MKRRPLALFLALLALAGPAAFAARGGDRGKPRQSAINGVVASVDETAASFVLRLESKKRGRRGSQTVEVTVRTSAETAFYLGDRSPGSFADVTAGVRAVVKGTRHGDGTLLAQVVALKAARPPKETSVKGIIDAIDPAAASFILAARARNRDGSQRAILVITNAETVFNNEDGSDASFADLAEGDLVEARGKVNPDGSILSTAVKLFGEEEPPQPVKVRGIIDGVDAESASFSLRIGPGRAVTDAPSVRVLTDANTVFTKPDGTVGSFADVVDGVTAFVAGVRQEGGILATSVALVAPQPPHEVSLRGSVSSVDASTKRFILQPGDDRSASPVEHPSVIIHTFDDTAFQKADGSPAAFADLAAGIRVVVKGTANGDRSVNAKVVVLASEQPPHEVALRGIVASIDAGAHSFTLQPGDGDGGTREERAVILVHTSDATSFQKSDGSAATFADLAAGAKVGVKGTANPDRSVQAALVLIGVPEPPDEKRIGGYIAGIDAANHSFTLHPARPDDRLGDDGVVVHTDEHTVFTKGDGTAALFADLTVRMLVKCSGEFNEDGSFQASAVFLFPQAR